MIGSAGHMWFLGAKCGLVVVMRVASVTVIVNRMAIATDVRESDVSIIYYGNRGVVDHDVIVYGRIR